MESPMQVGSYRDLPISSSVSKTPSASTKESLRQKKYRKLKKKKKKKKKKQKREKHLKPKERLHVEQEEISWSVYERDNATSSYSNLKGLAFNRKVQPIAPINSSRSKYMC